MLLNESSYDYQDQQYFEINNFKIDQAFEDLAEIQLSFWNKLLGIKAIFLYREQEIVVLRKNQIDIILSDNRKFLEPEDIFYLTSLIQLRMNINKILQ